MLPLYILTQLFATGVAYIIPPHPAFCSFLIFLGVFTAHWLDLPPGAPKIVSAIWLITLSTRCSFPTLDPLPGCYGLIVGLCLAQCAVLSAQLLPPLTCKKVLDDALQEGFASAAELVKLVGKEFARSAQSSKFVHAGLKAQSQVRLNGALPRKIASRPNFLSSFVNIASGHGFYTADRLERVEYLQETLKQALEKGLLLPFVQAERPLGDLSKYRLLLNMLRDMYLRVLEMRKAVVDLDVSTDSEIGRYRVTIGPAMRGLVASLGKALQCVAALPRSGAEGHAHFVQCQAELSAQMEKTRDLVQEGRKAHFG